MMLLADDSMEVGGWEQRMCGTWLHGWDNLNPRGAVSNDSDSFIRIVQSFRPVCAVDEISLELA